MNIPALGQLKPHAKVSEWLISKPVAVPYFDRQELAFTIDGLEATDEAEAKSAVAAFLALETHDRLSAARYVFANYQAVAELVDDVDLACKIESVRDVWQHVQPSEIYVSRRHRREKAIYVSVTAECDWEPEHGLQLVYRHGRELVRVSAQDGHLTRTDAYDLPASEDRIVDEPECRSKKPAPGKKPWWKLW